MYIRIRHTFVARIWLRDLGAVEGRSAVRIAGVVGVGSVKAPATSGKDSAAPPPGRCRSE